MIVSKIKGGIGNQLFQYSFGYAQTQIKRTKLKLDLSWFRRSEDEKKGPGTIGRSYQLSLLNINFEEETEKEESYYKFSLINKFRNRLPIRWKAYLKEVGNSFDPAYLNISDNSYLDGFWQSPQYFNRYRSDLLSQLTLKIESEHFKSALEIIKSVPVSVSVHIRRGDYVKHSELQKIHGVLPVEYYHSAFRYFDNKGITPTYFLFTDDWFWVKEVFPEADNIIHICNEGVNPVEDLLLMSLCNHNIIANSTFSWWAAWLNKKVDKIIIAPKIWYAEKIMNQQTNSLIPDTWVRI